MPGTHVVGLAHGGVTVSDMDASLAFYREGLGLTLELDALRNTPYLHETLAVPFSEIRYVLLSMPGAPGTFVELLEYRGADRQPVSPQPCDPGSGHLCFLVDDAQAAFDRLVGLGYRSRSSRPVPVDSGVNAGGRIVYFADPDGYWVEMLERPRG